MHLRSVLPGLLALPLSATWAAADSSSKSSADGEDKTSVKLPDVSISASFPQSEIFGVKIVNGLPTDALLDIQNNEPDPVGIQAVTGALWTPDFGGANPPRVFRNLTTILYQVELASGGKQSLNYRFSTEMHPAELVLRLVAAVVDSQGHAYSVPAYEGTVSVVEKPTSIFDPQIIFLYVILAAGFAGTAYFVYNTWISTLFPQTKRKGGKGGERARTSTKGTKKVDPSDQVAVAGADGPAVTSGSRAYDESWIPQHHINRPEAKRVRSGTPSGVKTKKAS